MTIARVIEGHSFAIHSCDVATSVRDAVELLADHRIGALPVLDGGCIAGIFSERDVIHQLRAHGPAMLDLPVGQVMTAPVTTIDPQTSVMDALALMTERRFRHLPVVHEGRMIGFVSIGDLVKHRIDRVEAEAEAMRSYIQAV